MAFYLLTIGQPLFGGGIINLNKGIAGIENITPKNKLNSGNSDEEVNLIKDKLFIYLLVNWQKPGSFNKERWPWF